MILSSFMSIFIIALPVLLGIYGLFYFATRRFQQRFEELNTRIHSLENTEAYLTAEREDLQEKLADLQEDYERLLQGKPRV